MRANAPLRVLRGAPARNQIAAALERRVERARRAARKAAVVGSSPGLAVPKT